MPLRPDSRSDGKSGGLRPRPDTQLARLAEPVPAVPEMLTGAHAGIHHSIALSTVQGTDLLLGRKKQDNIKSNGAVFHISDSNCVAKLPVGVHKTGGHRSHPIPVRPPVVPSLKPKPPERTTSENSLPGSKEITVSFLTPESKPDPSETIPSESARISQNKQCPAFADSNSKVPEERATASVDPASSSEVADGKPGAEAPKTKEGHPRSLALSSPRSSQLSLYLAHINERETGRTSSPAPPALSLPPNRTSLPNLIPPEEKDYRRSPSPLHPVQASQTSQYFLPIQKSPLKETTGKKPALSDHFSTDRKSPLPDYIPSGYKSPLPECIVKNLVRQSSSRTSIPEVHEPGPSPSKPVKKECVCGDSRRPPTPVRPKSVAFAIDDEDIRIPPPPPPPKSVTKTLGIPAGISKATSCPGIIYSPRKDILIVKQPLAIIKPSVSPVQTIGIKSRASGKIIITGGGDIEAEVVSVVTAGGELLSVVCEKQGGGSEKSCAVDGSAGRTALRSEFNSSLASLVGSSVRRSSVTSLSGSSLASLVVGGCCGVSEFGGLIIGDDIVVMGASGGAGAGAKGASGGSEAESCGGGACRKILSGRQQQQQVTSAGPGSKQQPQQQQFQQPKGGGGPGPGPGGGGGTQVRDETSSKPSKSHSPSQYLNAMKTNWGVRV